MGFFSSRKAEDNNSYRVSIGVAGVHHTNEKSVVQVIRSRFYGKKGKEREDQPVALLSGVSANQTLSPPVASSPISESSKPGPSTLRNERHLPATPVKKRTNDIHHTTNNIKDTLLQSKPQSIVSTFISTSPRKITDTVTVTLAQRLDELAAANSEGLLNDDEYRILRQNLFERFASNAAVPIEEPMVPAAAAAAHSSPKNDRPSSRPISNFQVEVPRPSSIMSTGSGVVDLFRQATSRRSSSKDHDDTSSIWSGTSNTSFFKLPRMLSKKSSNSSIRTTASRVHADTVSLSSRRPASISDKGTGEFSPQVISGSKSVSGSIRRLATPPSSFPTRVMTQESRQSNSMYNVFDEDQSLSVKEVTQEILNVEAEAKRLMDAFNGLEVTTLATAQRRQGRPTMKMGDNVKNVESIWGLESEGRSIRRVNLADDSLSMRSVTSAGTAPSIAASMARSAYSARRGPRAKAANSSISFYQSSLSRKSSWSSVGSERRPVKAAVVPPVPALPNSVSQGHLKSGNDSNISLAKSSGHLPMNTVWEGEPASTINTLRLEGDEEAENQMADIRRRREEVSHRYEDRLEYLRAKLKTAELHERLMRK